MAASPDESTFLFFQGNFFWPRPEGRSLCARLCRHRSGRRGIPLGWHRLAHPVAVSDSYRLLLFIISSTVILILTFPGAVLWRLAPSSLVEAR